MKKLVLSALVLGGLAQLATGCVIATEDATTITARWSLVEGDANSPAVCPAAATTMALYADDGIDPEPYTRLFDCVDGIGTSDLPPGDYYVWLSLTDDTGSEIFAQSRGTDVFLADGADSPVSFEISLDRGDFSVGWNITYGGVQSDCAETGAVQFAMDYTDSLGDLFGPDTFPCTDGSGTSRGVAVGTWSVSPSLLDATPEDGALGVGDSIDTMIRWGTENVNLGLVEIDVPIPPDA